MYKYNKAMNKKVELCQNMFRQTRAKYESLSLQMIAVPVAQNAHWQTFNKKSPQTLIFPELIF